MKIPTQKEIDDLFEREDVQLLALNHASNLVIDMDPELQKLTGDQREKLKAFWRKLDKWEFRLRRLKKAIFG